MKSPRLLTALFTVCMLAATSAFLFSVFTTLAHAADFYVATLVPGADAGTTASVGIGSGEQYDVFCETYGTVRYRVCQSSSCTATSTDSRLTVDKHNDICSPSNYAYLSVYKAYDGGNPSCFVYKVNPSMKGMCER